MYWNENEESGRRCNYILIAVNVLTYLVAGTLDRYLALNTEDFRNGAYWQIVTAMFMHGGLLHLLFNMYALYLFGGFCAPILGVKRYLTLYFTAGILGNAVWLASAWNNPAMSVLGASGAVMGVIMASAMIRPDIPMMFLFVPFPVKLRTMALVFLGLDILQEVTGAGASVAYLAHIGGFLGGYLIMRFAFQKYVAWDPLNFTGNKHSQGSCPPPGWKMSGGESASSKPESPKSGPVTQKELDYLLDKISRDGINSLSEHEMGRLRQAREQMRGDGR